MTTTSVHSPIKWVGGKYFSASRILAAFPPLDSYRTYVEVFGGAAHVLCRKPAYNHLEVYNDLNGDLVNFWMHCRDYPQELQSRIDSLPYSRQLYYDWHNKLFASPPSSDMERAVRWFYVLRSCFGSDLRKPRNGWAYTVKRSTTGTGGNVAQALHTAASLFSSVAERFRHVQIEQQDFGKVITTYASPTTLFYCDPPYVGAESYYTGVPLFSEDDHRRLAALLNQTTAFVALSYYPHSLIDALYPTEKWRRLTWQTTKYVAPATTVRPKATELLLLNYPEMLGSESSQ